MMLHIVSVGHTTVMGTALFFTPENTETHFDRFDPQRSYTFAPELLHTTSQDHNNSLQYFAKIDLEVPIVCYSGAKFIASKLDTDIRMFHYFRVG